MRNKMFGKSKLGFTLIEVVIAILILAVMAGVLAPTLIKYMEESRVSLFSI